jgi:glycosyltransferase involved in cell wall biosynthesis
MIPLLFPEWFPAADAAMVRLYWSKILPIADLVICNSRVVENDMRAIAEALGVRVPASAVAPLGFDLPAVADAPDVLPTGLPAVATVPGVLPAASPAEATAPGVLPAGPPAVVAASAVLPAALEAGRYALVVSTIEPRKGHALLLDVWERLLARDIPQRHGFRLVFVGRPGWHVDDVLRRIAALSRGGTLLPLQGVGDAELDALYRGAAFCLYPSLYEGFGLPIIEAFARGKAVIASTGGAVPETAGDLAPCLDPTDAAAWEQALADWIERPEFRADYEARIRAGFSHPTWVAAAAHILTLAKNLSDDAPLRREADRVGAR